MNAINWAPIPATIFSLLTLTMLIGDRAGEFLVALMLFAMAAPFFFVYFT